MSPAQPKKTCVWVYVTQGAEAESIELSIQFAQRNLIDCDSFVVCGDRPPNWNGDFIESPRIPFHEYSAITGQKMARKWRKYVDSIHKLNRIIASELVSDSFLWMYDDTFILKPTTFDELAIARHRGPASVSSQQLKKKGWREAKRRTFDVLANHGLPVNDYSTHAPTVYEKSKLQHTIEHFQAFTRPRVIESLYLNHWNPTGQRIKSSFFQYVTCQNDYRPTPNVLNVGNGSMHHWRERLKAELT